MTEVRQTSSTGGQKGSKDERFDLLPPEALAELARIYAMGSRKYKDHNYRLGYDWSLSYASLQRHANQFWSGEDTDEESGLSHIMHAAWHAFALYMFTLEHPDFDDRLSTIRAKKLVEDEEFSKGTLAKLFKKPSIFDVNLAELGKLADPVSNPERVTVLDTALDEWDDC